MRSIAMFAGAIVTFALSTLCATPAAAQATRTWVSGVGDDANPCSRTAPCKTFAGAISKTAAGGEINCLDSGGFGAVTITKSITIRCEGVIGGVLGAGTNGIIVNGAGIDVQLYGLDINGTGTGVNGVRFIQGNSLTIEHSFIRGYGFGVRFEPSTTARLNINGVTITNNGTAATGGGVLVRGTGSGSARATLNDVQITNHARVGLEVDTTGLTGLGLTVVVENSSITNSERGILVNAPAGTTTAVVTVNHSAVAHNNTVGISSSGTTALVRVSNTTITNNGLGVSAAAGASLASYGNNRLDGNPTAGAPNNGAFTGTLAPQ